ncbi:ABC transporter G family member 6-like [Phalaenopsis equestris]|uniref:ABC transporter G family member 6-like n=1 Tax=Phalaenopsis equestris TaxID=78828 RepID=UPI0009E3C0DB|nr:ABC transporter G family member 6-like [Phalaenopsis equestris]
MLGLADRLPFFERRMSTMEESSELSQNELLFNHYTAGRGSQTLGQLLKRVGDISDHQVPEFGELSPEPGRSIPFVLAFSDLSYSVKVSKKLSFLRRGNGEFSNTRMLLDNISGEAKEGEILAVLGASGSGKSTLIDALANRISKESLRGSISLNGEPLDSKLLKVISAYVMQDDLLYPMLTVQETLMFAAEFRLPRTLSKSKKKSRVQTLIDQLGLRRAAKTIIGDEGHRGVSGGERRRVSIGTDIIHDPIILFLDEPTSGLDSTSAYMVVQVLKRIAESGSIVIMSIHQPSYRILGLLDRLLFLSRGQTVFSGTPNTLPHYFAEFGKPIPENENRTEYALDVIRELESTPGGAKPATNSRRTPELFGIRLGAVLVTGFILATIFWKLDNSPKGVQERMGFFAIAMSTMFYTCADALPVFLQERYIFMRETAYNAYRRSSYVLSNAIVSFPSLVLLSAAFAATTFFAVGLAGGTEGFIFFFLIVLASFWAGSGFVTFLSGIVSHVMLGYTIVVAILAYFLLFSGFFITRDRIPAYWIWFHYLSLVKYPYEGVLQNEFDNPRKCFVRGVQMFDNTPLGALPTLVKVNVLKAMSDSLGVGLTSRTCITTGTDILKEQGVTDLSKWGCFWVTVAWGFLFRIFFYFALLAGSKNKRS